MEYFGDEFSDSAWYYNHQLYRVGGPLPTTDDAVETHGYWISKHGREFGLNIPHLEWDDDGSPKWQEAMRIAFNAGFIRIQKFNDITTISIANFSSKYVNKVFELINDYPEYLNGKNIEVMTLQYECSQFDEDYDCPQQGNYICADNLQDLMIKLDNSITSSRHIFSNYIINMFSKLFSRVEGETWTDSKGKTWKYHEGIPDEKLDYDVNEKLPNRATFHAYKMFKTKYNPEDPKTFKYKGQLFPLYINAKTPYEIGSWYKSGHGAFKVLCDENGEPILDKSGNPTCKTIEKDLAYRPGLHMGSLPIMRQRGRSDLPHESTNNFDYFHSQEVFAEVEYSGTYDYTEKSKQRQAASAEPDNPYSAGFTDNKDFENGYYKFKTSTNASDDEAWFIADAMKIIRVITDEEMLQIIKDSGTNIKPQIRGEPNGKDGDMFVVDFTQFNITSSRHLFSKLLQSKNIYRIANYNTDVGYEIKSIFHKLFPNIKIRSFMNPSPTSLSDMVAAIEVYNLGEADEVLSRKDEFEKELNNSKVYSSWDYKVDRIEKHGSYDISIFFEDLRDEITNNLIESSVIYNENLALKIARRCSMGFNIKNRNFMKCLKASLDEIIWDVCNGTPWTRSDAYNNVSNAISYYAEGMGANVANRAMELLVESGIELGE